MDDYWAEDPHYPHADWKHEVANGDTLLGYHQWVAHRRASDGAGDLVREFRAASALADAAAEGDSTDAEIEALQHAVELAKAVIDSL